MSHFNQFHYPMIIKEHHLDTFGHVNNATYLSIMEEARWEFLNVNGFSLPQIHQLGVGPIVLECQIKFIKELTLRQKIVIESQLLSYEKKIGMMRQDILDEQGTLCSHAQMTFGFFDLSSRKLILPSTEWLRAIGYHEND
jgi:thioesterase-3